MRTLPALLALVLLLPIVPPAAAQTENEHWLNADQPIVRPGQAFSVTVSGHGGAGGAARLSLLRLTDPAAARDLSSPEGLGGLEKIEERQVVLEARKWSSTPQRYNLTTPGIYILESQRGDVVRRVYVQVTEVSFIVKTGATRAIAYAFSLDTGAPVAGARFLVNGTEVGRTDAGGVVAFSGGLRGPVVMLSGASASMGDLDAYRWDAHAEDLRIVTQLDRPIYRPGQTVHLKATTLRAAADAYVPYNASALQVRVVSYARGGENVAYEATLVPNARGSVATSFALPDDAPIGEYSVRVTAPGGVGGWSSFGVEAYRKPRVDVEVETQRPHYVRGEEVVAHAKASWFFGSPVTRGEVRYEVRPNHYGWYDDCRFCYYSFPIQGPRHETPPSYTGKGELRPDGTFSLTVKPDADDWTRSYEIEVFVTAESGEQASGTTTFLLHPSGVDLRLETTSYAYRPGDPIVATATVKDHDGRPLAGVPVRLALEQERGDARASTTGTTDANGLARMTLPAPTSGGGFTLIATTQDAGGREARATRWVWVSDARTPWYADEGVKILPEKERYGDGETLRALIIAAKPSHVLVTLEGNDLHAWTTVGVDGSAYVEFPVRGTMAPMVVVSTLVVRPSPYGPNTWQDQAWVDVGPDPRALNVTIVTDKPAYRDADDVRLMLLAKDRAGRPVQGEFALGVVDESIYRLREDRTGPLLTQVYPQRHDVRLIAPWWSLSWGGHRGEVAFADAASTRGAPTPPPTAPTMASLYAFEGSAKSTALDAASVRVREEFPDTALWLPFVTTDADGVARVQMQAPDTLTRWRMTARGFTDAGLVGDARGEFTTRKPLMLEPNLPRFLVQGDALTMPVVVFNHVGELRDVEVHMVLAGAIEATGTTSRRVTLSDGDSVRLDFPVRALDNASNASVTFVAFAPGSTNESDAIRLTLPVLPHGVLQKAVKAGADDASFFLPLPGGPYAKAPEVTVTLSASMGGAVLDALPGLLGYPYGCVEQTMSRFMPAVVATKALREAGFEVDDANVSDYVEKGLARLARFQNSQGGWGWWQEDAGHPYMTAYVVAGLAEAKRAGVVVDAGMLQRGVDALTRMQANETDGDLAAYEAYALALAGARVPQWPTNVTADGLALVGLAKALTGDRAGAMAAWRDLERQAIREEGRIHWSGARSEWRHHGIRSDVQLTAHALRLMVALDVGRDTDAPLVVAWLASERRGHGWGTTKDTAESVLAVVDFLRGSSELTPAYDAVVTIGNETQRIRFDDRSDRVTLTLPAAGPSVQVKLAREGAGRLYWTAVAASVPRAEVILPEDRGFAVTRTIADTNGVPAKTLVFGEEYVVTVNVTTKTERGHVMLRSWLPAGIEVVRDTARGHGGPVPLPWEGVRIACWDCWWGGSWTSVETRDDHVAAFATRLPAGTATLTYRIRAMTPGDYHVMPTEVEEMYHPDVYGRSGEDHVTVTSAPRLLLGSAVVLDTGIRFQVHGEGRTLDLTRLSVRLRDANGTIVPAQISTVQATGNGTAEVVVAANGTMPPVVTLEVIIAEQAVTRRIDLTGSALRYDGTFSATHETAWAAGAPIVAAADRSPRADVDPSLFRAPQERPQDGPPTPERPPEAPTLDLVPGAPLVAVAAVVVLAALAMRLRRRG